jgi:hypothetical protein
VTLGLERELELEAVNLKRIGESSEVLRELLRKD